MHPAFSVIFFTTLAGTGQGLFLALFLGQVYDYANPDFELGSAFFANGGAIALAFLTGGLIASIFHLGHPMRGWRAFSQWRTSWLSREVIALPAMMIMTFLYAAAHFIGQPAEVTITIGVIGLIVNLALFICTGMIYACISFIREWATPLTIVNFVLIGAASGFSFAVAYAAVAAPELVNMYGRYAIVLTGAAMIIRAWMLSRNKQLRESQKSTTQTATGFRNPNVRQTSMGLMGGSYNTREFFHGQTEAFIKNIKAIFIIASFVAPIGLLAGGLVTESLILLGAAHLIQYAGLLAERWHFFASANHPQNIYYQSVG